MGNEPCKPMRYAVWNNKSGVGKSFLSVAISRELVSLLQFDF